MRMHLSTKGQVTIPQSLRERLGLSPGSEVEVVLHDDGALVRAVDPADGASAGARAFLDRLRGSASVRMSTDELMALTRGED